MKRNNIIFSALTALAIFAVSCSKDVNPAPTPQPEEGATAEKVVITALFPQSPDSKVAMEETDGGLDLKWKDTDFLTVVGETTEKFTIVTISDDGKTATFTGNPVEGETFKVILSDKGENYDKRTLDSVNPDKDGDLKGNIPYDAVLENVADYTNVSFTQEWADANGAKFSESGCLMIYLQLPENCNNVKYVKLFAYDNVFSKTNAPDAPRTHFKQSVFTTPQTSADGLLKVYYPTSMNEDTVPSGTDLCVLIETSKSTSFYKIYTPSGEFKLLPGRRNVLKLNSRGWTALGTHGWSSDQAKWSAPYANITNKNGGPAYMIDNNKGNFWEYPYNEDHTVVDTSFDEWTRESVHEDGRGAAPFVGIINFNEVRLIQILQFWPRQAKQASYLTECEAWVSIDTSNDTGMEDYLAKNLQSVTSDDINGKWEFWKAKKWFKVADFNTNGGKNRVELTLQGIPAKYVMIKCLDNGKYSNNFPVFGVGEVYFRLFAPLQ